jgi:hypothetical protein
MPLIIFAPIWYIFIGIWIFLFQKRTQCFSTWNTFTVFVIFLISFHAIYVPFTLDYYDFLPISVLVNFIIGLIIMYVFILIGVEIVNFIFRFNPAHIDKKIVLFRKGFNPLFFWPIFFIILSLIFYKLFSAERILTLADFIWLTKTPEEYKEARIIFSQSTNSSQNILLYIANICTFVAWPLFIYLFYFIKGKTKSFFYTIFFWLLLILFLYQGIISGHKGTSLTLLLGLFICWLIKNKNSIKFKIFDKKIIILGTILFFLILPYLYMVQYSGEMSYKQAFYSTWFRLTIEPNRVLQLYYYTYPEKHPYLFGASSHWIAKILGYGEGLSPNSYIPSSVFRVDNTSWNVIFIGDAWADFGFIGVIFSSLIVGILLQCYNVWFVKTKKTALTLSTYVVLIISAYKLTSCGLGVSFLTFGVVSVFVLFLALAEMGWLKKSG